MTYEINMPEFEGPLDLLLHLIKQSDINIFDISIEKITKQYLDFIKKMEEMNLNVASEYLVMAAELIEMKSVTLLPNQNDNADDEYEEDPREQLINRLLEYQYYKEVSNVLKDYESERNKMFSKVPSNLDEYAKEDNDNHNQIDLNELLEAFSNFLERRELDKPLNTKITTKEFSVSVRSNEIKEIIKNKKKVEFTELFDVYTRDYIVVTFLSILDLAKKQELKIVQDSNFYKIYLIAKGSE
ncbi:MAG: segregation/condensation protein A [Ignavibacteriales bacterium]